MNEIVKHVQKYGMKSAIATFGMLAVNSAMAALPASIGTAVSDATADGVELGWLMVGLAVVVGVIFYLKRKA